MFHWICPECGREIPPKLKECPSCDPQSAPVVPEAVVNDAPEVVNEAPVAIAIDVPKAVTENAPEAAADHASKAAADNTPETVRQEPAPLVNAAADSAVAPDAAESPAPAEATGSEPSAGQATSTATNPIEPAAAIDRATGPAAISLAPTDRAVTEEPAAVKPEITRVPVEGAAVAAAQPASGDATRSESGAGAPPESGSGSSADHPLEFAANAPSTPAQLEPIAAGPSEPPADLAETRRIAIHLAIRQPDAAVAESPETTAPGNLGPTESPAGPSLGPVPSPDPARDPLLALAEQIRDAQTQPVLSFTDDPALSEPAHVEQTEPPHPSIDVAPRDVAPRDVAPKDAAPEHVTPEHPAPEQVAPERATPQPPPVPDEPVPVAVNASAPPSRVNPRISPDEAVTEEIFLPPVLAQLAASIGVSEPRPTAPEPVSRASVSTPSVSTPSVSTPSVSTPSVSNGSASTSYNAEHGAEHIAALDTERAIEPVAQSSPAPVTEPASVSRATSTLVLAPEPTESVSPIQSSLQVESPQTQVEPDRAYPGQLSLLADAGPLALLAPPEAAPAPLETAVMQAPPEPVASTTQTATHLAAPQLPITGLASPDDPASAKAPSGSWLQLAPLQDYSAATAHSMQPVPLAAKILTPDSGPRMTLPGPTLPPELARFQDANLVTVIGDTARTGKFRLPGWAVSFLVMLTLLVIGVGVVFYFLPVAHSSAETQAPVVEGHGNTSQPAAPPPVPSQPAAHPLAQFVEVTGFRIVVDFNKKSEIHYLVVNHSGADLSDVTVYVTLRTAGAKPGQPPVCRFSFRAPNLGPFESKEMTSTIEKLSRAITLPEWQDLRPEVQIAQ